MAKSLEEGPPAAKDQRPLGPFIWAVRLPRTPPEALFLPKKPVPFYGAIG
jgi:hypothetical protein